jgi:curli biogenesis system outer membrane secretion channel CsgG
MKVFRPMRRRFMASLALLALASLALFNSQPVTSIVTPESQAPNTLIVQQPAGYSGQQLVILCQQSSSDTAPCPTSP